MSCVRIIRVALVVFFAVTLLTPGAADDKESKKKKKGGTSVGKPELTAEEREKVIERLDATSAEFDEDGILWVTYDFESMRETLAEDWLPNFSRAKGRVRWTQGYEGSAEGISGILICQNGAWMHEARWAGEVEMEIEFMPMSTSRKGDLVAAVYRDAKGKQIVGSNGGTQCVQLRGTKVRKAFPKETPSFRYNTRKRFGFRVKDGLLEALENGSVRADSSKSKSFLKKLPTGHVGVVWNGQVNGIISRVRIQGKIDPDWVRNKKR